MPITLLSDFGLTDGYVGSMKGVIAQIAPHATVIDLTHLIPPQDIAAARFHLMVVYPDFPAGTVHIAVVDPGVGGPRRAIAVQLSQGWLVGPDNGLFSGVLRQHPAVTAIELTNPHYWRRPSPSATFQGRDIFAPVGAHLANGVAGLALGRAIDPDTLVQLHLPPLTQVNLGKTRHIQGCIQAIDHFGNLITNIPESLVQGCRWQVQVAEISYASKLTYAAGQPGQIISLVGSHGWVEIAVNQGSAAQQLGMAVGGAIALVLVITE